MISSPCPAREPIAIWFAMVPVGVQMAASLPNRAATLSCSWLMVGSSPKTSSPTSASCMALRMPGPGRVTVSLRRSMRSMRPHMLNGARMARESKEARSRRFREIVRRLEKAMPEAKIALEYQDELQLLVSVMLSAQCTDAVVNTVTPALFARYRTAADYARSTPSRLGEQIRRVGLWRAKSKALHAAMTTIAQEFGGKLPRTREELCQLPGVGWKTAGVVVNHAFGTPALPVDTHVGRVARRLGLSRQEDPRKVEDELASLLPEKLWGRAHQLLIWHGRRTCESRRPHCSRCVVLQLCPRRGVTESD